jgi:glucokinase
MSSTSDRLSRSVGVEISNTSLRAVLLSPDGAVERSMDISLGGGDDTIQKLAEVVADLNHGSESVGRIGVAIPGLVERNLGRVAYSAIIPGQSDVNLAASIKQATGLDVVLENDANAAAFGEFRCGAGRGARDMFYATLGVGVGGAFIINGEIWHGASGFAGEFGYVPIDSEGMRLEDVASSANVVRRTRSRFHQDSTSSLGKLNEESLTLIDIINAARNEDDFAQMMLGRTGYYVGTAIASVINLLNIECIVVGGEIMQAKKPVLNGIIARARDLSFAPSFESTRIVAGELGFNAAAVGAALISRESTD